MSRTQNDNFYGLYECRLDGSRITLPWRFRKSVLAYDPPLLLSLESTSSNGIIKMDGRGRIRLPSAIIGQLRGEEAQTVKLIGAITSIDMWTPAEWEELLQETVKEFDAAFNKK